jgi:Flp pilus assembly protein TadG
MKATTTENRKNTGRLGISAGWGSKRAECGQSMAEFALMLPFLCLLSVGIAEIGRTTYTSLEVTNAATAGVEYGSQNATTMIDTNGMQSAATSEASVGGMSANATYGCTCDKGGGTSAEACTYPVPAQSSCASICASGVLVQCVQVTTQASLAPIFHFPGLPSSYQSNGRAVMRVRK